jgi:hypothetical protein
MDQADGSGFQLVVLEDQAQAGARNRRRALPRPDRRARASCRASRFGGIDGRSAVLTIRRGCNFSRRWGSGPAKLPQLRRRQRRETDAVMARKLLRQLRRASPGEIGWACANNLADGAHAACGDDPPCIDRSTRSPESWSTRPPTTSTKMTSNMWLVECDTFKSRTLLLPLPP